MKIETEDGKSSIVSAEANVESGLVQTGIQYPRASNPMLVAKDNIDGSVIEFATNSLDFNPNDYRLLLESKKFYQKKYIYCS